MLSVRWSKIAKFDTSEEICYFSLKPVPTKKAMSRKLTIKQIAELSGVSKSTVSRVLNGYPHIRPEVREKVQKVIDETNYQPSNVARLLASDRSNIIGLVISSGPEAIFKDPYFPAVTEGVAQSIGKNNLTLALFIFYSEEEGRETVEGIIRAGLVDGVIVTADHKGSSFVPQLLASDLPFVYIGRPDNAQGVSYVDTDNVGGGYLATQHLIKLGKRRIAKLASDQNSAGDDRLEGYRQALEEHEIPFNNQLVAFGDYTLDSGYEAMKRLITEEPEAVYISSDTMALGALRALREHNLRVPYDIAVVSHDDLLPAVQADPQLTTVHQPVGMTGQLAVETLMKVIVDESASPHKIVLPDKLVVRASCGAES